MLKHGDELALVQKGKVCTLFRLSEVRKGKCVTQRDSFTAVRFYLQETDERKRQKKKKKG